jgi:hypothetical protein
MRLNRKRLRLQCEEGGALLARAIGTILKIASTASDTRVGRSPPLRP